MEFSTLQTINLMVLNKGDSEGMLILLDGGEKTANELKNIFHDVFTKEKIDDFLKSLAENIEALKNRDLGIEKLGDKVSIADLGEMGKMISVELGFPPEYVLLQYAKRIWRNPKKEDEIYISYEVNIYLSDGLHDNFQRVLVKKGDIVYNVSLKV